MMGDVSGPAVGKRKRDYGPCPKSHKVVNIVFDGTDDIATADLGAKSYGDDWVALETAAQKGSAREELPEGMQGGRVRSPLFSNKPPVLSVCGRGSQSECAAHFP